MRWVRQIGGGLLMFIAAMVLLGGTSQPGQPTTNSTADKLFMVALMAVGAWLILGPVLADRRKAQIERTQKLLQLAESSGELTVPSLVRALSVTPEEAEEVLKGLHKHRLLTVDFDENGGAIYRLPGRGGGSKAG